MKTIAGYLGLIGVCALLYWLNFFAWISRAGFLVFIFIVIAILFVIAFRVLGNPFRQGENRDENK